MTTGLVAALTDPYGFSVFAVAFSPHGGTLAASDNQGNTHLWDVATRHQITEFYDPTEWVGSNYSVAFSPDGRTLAAAGADGVIYMWDMATRHLFATHADPGSRGIYSVAFSPNGRMLAAADTNGNVYLWDAG